MNKEIYIIGSSTDREAIMALQPQFAAEGFDIAVGCSDADALAKEHSMGAENVALWLTSKSEQHVFDIASERNSRNVATVNIFAEPMEITPQQKSVIGRNRSVFSTMSDNLVKDTVALMTGEAPAIPLPQNKPTVSSESTSTTVESSSVEEKPEADEKKSSGYKPWKALIVILATYVVEYCIEDAHQFYNNEIMPYILFAVWGIICAGSTGGVMTWRDENGKTTFSGLVIFIGSLMVIYWAWLFVKNLWNFIF